MVKTTRAVAIITTTTNRRKRKIVESDVFIVGVPLFRIYSHQLHVLDEGLVVGRKRRIRVRR
jgi:hypothetical protein